MEELGRYMSIKLVLIDARFILRYIVCAIILLFSVCRCENDFFLAQSNQVYKCVTNSVYALTWINSDGSPVISEFIPIPKSSNNFDCDITKDEVCAESWINSQWTIRNALQNSENDIILDRRWEKLQTWTTMLPKRKKLHFQFIDNVAPLNNNFDIPFSIRTSKQAHIFLCDGKKVDKSNCYWIILQGWGGFDTVIRKCGRNKIPTLDETYPDGDCSKFQQNTTHPQFLHKEYWTHLKLTKSNNYIALKNNFGNIIIDFADKHKIDVKYLILHSKNEPATWKIHNYDYLYTEKEAEDSPLGNNIFFDDNVEICISMFIYMCATCTLKIKIVSNNENNIVEEEFINIEGKTIWKEIKIVASKEIDPNAKFGVLRVTTVNNGPSPGFWGIDSPRSCLKTEYRVITANRDYPCQLLRENFTLIHEINSDAKSSCKEDEIGNTFCVSCNLLFDQECSNIKVCEKIDSNIVCVCSAGYLGYYCGQKCPYQRYGHGCQNNCEHCANNCNNVNGTCDFCKSNYFGPKCDITSGIFFSKPPEIVDETLHTCVVAVENFDVNTTSRESYTQKPRSYYLQYKQLDDGNNNKQWLSIGSSYRFNDQRKIEIEDLLPETKYRIRALITDELNNVFDDERYVPSVICKTICQPIQGNDIGIEIYNTSIQIHIQAKKDSCKPVITYNHNNNRGSKKLIANTNIISKLKPDTEYRLEITQSSGEPIYKIFRTDEGIPGKVKNLKAKALSPTSIEITWTEPSELNGKLQKYIVRYKHLRYIPCPSDNQEFKYDLDTYVRQEIAASVTTKVVGELIPNSLYGILVNPATKYEGDVEYTTVQTRYVEEIGKDEVPAVKNIKPYSDMISIEFLQISCTKIRGPLFIDVVASCYDKWCKNNSSSRLNTYPVYNNVSLQNNIYPFSSYRLEAKVCRNESCRDIVIKDNEFTTPATAPYPVSDLQVYAKDSASVSLRWKPPYPPTGTLTEYKISFSYYSYYARNYNKDSFANIPCSIWPNYHCYQLNNLYEGYEYTIAVSAKNKESSKFSPPSAKIIVIPNDECSEAPYNLNTHWTDHNELLLSWYHPNLTNGNLQSFSIEIKQKNSSSINFRYNLEFNQYKLIYNYNITHASLVLATEYTVRISSIDSSNCVSRPIETTDTSPPEIPSFKNIRVSCESNDTIFVEFELQQKNNVIFELYFYIWDATNNNDNMAVNATVNPFSYLRFINSSIIYKCNLTGNSFEGQYEISIRNTNYSRFCTKLGNEIIKPGSLYNVIAVFNNTYGDKSRIKSYLAQVKTAGINEFDEYKRDNNLLILLLLLLIIPIGILIFIKRNQLARTINSFIFDIGNENISNSSINIPLDASISSKNIRNDVKSSTSRPTAFKKETTNYSKRVKISDLEQYVRESIANNELARQHALFPRGQTQSWDYAALKENKSKNRYNNLLAYDHSRVVLNKINDDPYSDYINANYIDGYKVPKAYIATQGPKPNTVSDFWRMIWEKNVQHIVMLANVFENGKKKVENYWPSINEEIAYGAIKIQFVSNEVFADYECRSFNITCGGELRKVEQLHFTSWPDHGIPLYSQSLVPFLRRLLKFKQTPNSPIVVHCSAGVGRTGTVMLCDINLRMAAREGAIDVLNTLQKLRYKRPNMVDNVEQYKLAHLVILECLSGMHTSIPCSELNEKTEAIFNSNGIRLQMNYLLETVWKDQAMKSVVNIDDDSAVTVKEKNRFQNITPDKAARIYITRYPIDDETSSYINAVKVDGFRCPGRFIVTQQPLPNTLGDFWRLVSENDIQVIVSLNEINKKDKTSCEFWPNEKNEEMNPVEFIKLKHLFSKKLDGYNIVDVEMNLTTQQETKKIQVIEKQNWPPRTLLPRTVEEFLTFWVETDILCRNSKTVLVTCYDGAKASGLFVATSFLIEQMKLEQICDVCQVVRVVRHNRQQFVKDEAQFSFLYKIAMHYVSGFAAYSNFN